jgi:hypothetical protein
VSLAPSPGGAEPVPLDLDLEALQTLHIAWHAVIVVMPLGHPSAKRVMMTSPDALFLRQA